VAGNHVGADREAHLVDPADSSHVVEREAGRHGVVVAVETNQR